MSNDAPGCAERGMRSSGLPVVWAPVDTQQALQLDSREAATSLYGARHLSGKMVVPELAKDAAKPF